MCQYYILKNIVLLCICILPCVVGQYTNPNLFEEIIMETTAIINTINTSTTSTTSTNAPLKIKWVEIDAATGESGLHFDGNDAPLIAANINALAVGVLAESYRQQRAVELGDIGERISISESEHVMQTVREYYTPENGFDFLGYYCNTDFWGADPELSEILEQICWEQTPIWSQWKTGRLGYIAIDREKATLLSIPPRKIARDELRATTTAARVAPRAFLYSVLRDLVSFGAESTWLENQANLQWGNLPGSPIKPGKLLRKIVPGMGESWYISKSEELASRIKQRFSLCDQIKVSHDIESIYNMGGTFVSCMKNKGELYKGIMEAFPDVSIAYLTDAENGRLLGRAILWPDVRLSSGDSIKLMDRIYSVSELVRQSFRRYAKINGYHYKIEDGHSCKYCSTGERELSLSGAYVTSSHMFSPGDWRQGAPYMDTFSQLDLGDDRMFCFTASAQVSLRETNGDGGWLTDPPTCSVCDREITRTDAETWGDSIYCSSCAQHLEECIYCGRYSHPDQGGIWTVDGFLCDCCEHHASQCESCNKWFYDVQMREIDIPGITGEICPSCFEKLDSKYDLRECNVLHCRTLILPDSPGEMCNHHASTLGHVCAECGEWTSTESATQFGTFWFCPDCVKLLLESTPLNVGFRCTNCGTFKKGKPAANCGNIVLCKECYTMEQAPDDYRPPRPRITPPPTELPETKLSNTLKIWCQRAKGAATPDEKLNIFNQLSGRIQTDCDNEPERHRQVFDSLLCVLPLFFTKTRGYYDNNPNATIIECSYMDGFKISIHLYHNRGTRRTWIETRQLDL